MTSSTGELFYSPDLSLIHHEGYTAAVSAAAPEIVRMLRKSGIQQGLVVDLGCGGGILLRELLSSGFQALGVDVSPAMLEIARATAPGATLIAESLHTIELPPCVAITSTGEGLGYVVDGLSPDLPLLFRRAFDALRPGGLLLFDIVVSNADEALMRYEATSEGSDWSVTALVDEDRERSLLTRRIRTRRMLGGIVRETIELHTVRLFTEREVLKALEGAGFEARGADGYGDQPLAPRRRAFIARKLP